MNNRIKWAVVVVAMGFACLGAAAQSGFTDAQLARVQRVVSQAVPEHANFGAVKVQSLTMSADTVVVDLNQNFGNVPFTEASIGQMSSQVRSALGLGPVKFTIQGTDISSYFQSFDSHFKRKHEPFVSPADEKAQFNKGLSGNIIALWQSHGLYFEPTLNRWEWQRGRLLQTVEDMYTQSYVIPFLNPMLENAGCYVWDARERDTHKACAVVDADGGLAQAGYREQRGGDQKWSKGSGSGFAYLQKAYRDFENPFTTGTYRQVATTTDKRRVATATWDVDMPESGNFAVYVSYKSLPGSATDAHYTVNSLGGKHTFIVNQRMAGGVWVYLGTFEFAKGLNKAAVTLTNLSQDKNAVVTADAVKVGGGTNLIERRPALPTEANKQLAADLGYTRYLGSDSIDYKYIGAPDYAWNTIGSRYYLQWAGFPKEVYSQTGGLNDYNDDYRSRGLWVNWLAGGSEVLPGKPGLNVPVDLSFCLHTDAGTTLNDSIIGTLGIYCTKSGDKYFSNYADGTPRMLSRRLTDMVLTEACHDVRAKWEPRWTRRGMRDASYYEARVPEVPALLLEFLSHQNFADMKYGLDPGFRFDVSRALYKGMLKFIAARDHRDYVVQPLPVNSFAITPAFTDGYYMLTWQPTVDSLTSNADAKSYLVQEQVADGGFRTIAEVKKTQYMAEVPADGLVHSYRIIAQNEGGRSFASEVLSCGKPKGHSNGTVMVVNGFTRISGPDWFDAGKIAGFLDTKDHGVPYMQQINYVGAQYEFRRALEWRDDDAGGFGASRATGERQVVAGNTFNYPALHGQSILQAGYSFVSASAKAVEDNAVSLSDYKVLDLILGKQKEIPTGSGAKPARFKAFTPALREALSRFTAAGGSVLVTGAYVGTDIWDNYSGQVNADEVNFAKQVLGFKWLVGQATAEGRAVTVPSRRHAIADGQELDFYTKLNPDFYAVESPDAIEPADLRSDVIVRYGENQIPAGVASVHSGYRTVVLGFPFETVKDADARNAFMAHVLSFFAEK